MIEVIMAWFDGLMRIVQTAPLQLWALVLGLLVSWGVTQRAKFLIPESLPWKNKAYIAQLMAFFTGFGTTWILWPDKYGFVVALLVGLFSPFTYSLMMNFMARKFPRTRRVLSLDYKDGNPPKKVKKPTKKVVVQAEVTVAPAPTPKETTE